MIFVHLEGCERVCTQEQVYAGEAEVERRTKIESIIVECGRSGKAYGPQGRNVKSDTGFGEVPLESSKYAGGQAFVERHTVLSGNMNVEIDELSLDDVFNRFKLQALLGIVDDAVFVVNRAVNRIKPCKEAKVDDRESYIESLEGSPGSTQIDTEA